MDAYHQEQHGLRTRTKEAFFQNVGKIFGFLIFEFSRFTALWQQEFYQVLNMASRNEIMPRRAASLSIDRCHVYNGKKDNRGLLDLLPLIQNFAGWSALLPCLEASSASPSNVFATVSGSTLCIDVSIEEFSLV
jgi:hypothetical protein